MDLLFLFASMTTFLNVLESFNPYSNGSSFFILRVSDYYDTIAGFNPYSNGSSFFIKHTRSVNVI